MVLSYYRAHRKPTISWICLAICPLFSFIILEIVYDYIRVNGYKYKACDKYVLDNTKRY